MKQKNFFKSVIIIFMTLFTLSSAKAQTLGVGDLFVITDDTDAENFLVVAIAYIPAGESMFFTNDVWDANGL